MKRKAQSALESTLAYVAGMAILGGAVGVFGWGIAHLPIRQATYEVTRVVAGTPRGRMVDETGAKFTFTLPLWPTYFVGGGLSP